MAWKTVGLRENCDLRSFFLIKRAVIVVANRAGSQMFCQNHIDDVETGRGENVTDLVGSDFRFGPLFFRKLESILQKQNFGKKITRRRSGILKGDDLTSKVFQPIRLAIAFGKNQASVFGHAAFPSSKDQDRGPLFVDDVSWIGA